MYHTMEDDWVRREHFDHYMNQIRCTYSLTVEIDITKLYFAIKKKNIKSYPVFIYLLSKAVNQHREFRMSLSGEGEPGYWEMLHPSYTIFNKNTETFSSIWTEYHDIFPAFYEACISDLALYKDAAAFAPKKGMPPNVFDISGLPWIDFTAFNLNVFGEGTHLLPIFTIGKYIEKDNRVVMPLAMQVHHAACDGYHAGQFIETLRNLVLSYHEWLN